MADKPEKQLKVIETDIRAACLAQIHAAIDRLQQSDFVSAIALGSAAEGILPDTDNPHLLTKLKEWQKSLPSDVGGATGVNDFNNWVKHGKGDKRPEKSMISELEVITSIQRAISKFAAIYSEQSPQMKAFAEWAIKRLRSSDDPRKPNKPQKLKARLPRGLADRGPAEIATTRAMVEQIRVVFERYGFEPVETPVIEYTDALGKFLPDQNRPNEGVFSFQDDDEQWLSLRYDLTAPLARYVAERIGTENLVLPYRSYRYGWVFRNEKPGPGRFRQFMQFDADTVGSASMAADAEMCMLAADTMEALGIPRGSYVVKVNNRKVLDGVMEACKIPPEKHLTVLRAMDKFDRLGEAGVRQLLDKGRHDESGDFTKGAELDAASIETIMSVFEPVADAKDKIAQLDIRLRDSKIGQQGRTELEEIASLVAASRYDDGRIVIAPSVVRGLEYYTGPVYEVELTFEIDDEKGRPIRFGSVGGGGRYDGLVSRFRGEPVPATGFSIGVSRLQAALAHLGKISSKPEPGPVVVTVFDRDRIADYQRMVSALREANIRAELYLGNPKNIGNQLKYADKRNAPCVVIQGGDEKARNEVQIKDLVVGAEIAGLSKEREDYLKKQAQAQFAVKEDKLVGEVRKLLKRHGIE
jgi:histidyl-tRNA synthetase